ncbi:MAG: L-aspartate oxidase [Candidatus Ratteibacteria bacterium]|nr:L-aspartate oxidase [Candidatus Ratteibacteria bacterium]
MIPDFFISFDTEKLPFEEVDFLIVGGGIAGITAALQLKNFRTVVLYKNGLSGTSTYNAQGGIAVAMAPWDSPEKHKKDTLITGCGLSSPESVDILVNEGIERIKEIISSGLAFDRDGNRYHFTREGGHSCRRILHIDGDSTGKAVANFLYKKALAEKNIKIFHSHFLIDLINKDNRIEFALVYDEKKKRVFVIRAKAFILATGGAGNIFQETTNPSVITGDGIATAYRCGAELIDLEFYQFHPTTFYQAGAPRFLISESVRGEGGILRNSKGERFMFNYHPMGELAPRDIVTRAIVDQMKATGSNCVYLDLKEIKDDLKKRFPSIYNFCMNYGIDIEKEYIPVRPSAHYFMGGIKTDINGRTSIENFFACGEAACTGVHGANRLASNSLLEGLVFGTRTGISAMEEIGRKFIKSRYRYAFPQKADILIDKEDLKRSIRSLMWRNVGIEREEITLKNAEGKITEWMKYAFLKEFPDTTGFETLNMLILALLITKASSIRKESRGAHFRKDYPEQDDKNWRKHIVIKKDGVEYKEV